MANLQDYILVLVLDRELVLLAGWGQTADGSYLCLAMGKRTYRT